MTATAFEHGVKTNQVPTSLLTPRRSMSALTTFFGCAPIHRLAASDQVRVKPGNVEIVYSLQEAGTVFGIDTQRDDFTYWTLSEAAYVFFQLMNVCPLVFVNLFDPAVHRRDVTNEVVNIVDGKGRLAHSDVIGGVTVTSADGNDTFQADVDFFLEPISGVITALDGGALAGVNAVTVTYAYAAPDMVTTSECIGGYDVVSGKTTGISLIDQVFPKFREVPTISLAPRFDADPAVPAILAAKMGAVNGIMRGIAVADLPSDGANAITRYGDVPSYKQKNGLTSPDLVVCWPKVTAGGRVCRLSVLAAARMAATDADNGAIPFVSPSNKALPVTSSVVDGQEVWLDRQNVLYLDGNGIVSVTQHASGWKLWGNHTACFPDNRDPKDYFMPSRRMMAWYGNQLTQKWQEKVDNAITRRLVETIVNTEQCYLHSLTSSGALNGGRIQLLQSENNILDLMDGQITFHVWLGLVAPAERIVFNVEYDPAYHAAVLGSEG